MAIAILGKNELAHVMPDAKFIYMHRNPYEFIFSGVRRGWYVDHIYDRYRIVPLAEEVASNRWESWSQIEKIAWFWNMENRYFLELEKRLGSERVAQLPFKEFVKMNPHCVKDLFNFIGVEAPEMGKVKGVMGIRHNEQVTGRCIDPDEWDESLRESVERIAGSTMKQLHYSTATSV